MILEYGFIYDLEKCIQCHGCEIACKSWRDLAVGIAWRRVKTFWKGQGSEVKNLSLSIACMHCLQPQCLDACPEGAIAKREQDGIVVVDPERCIGCQACLVVCPYGVPQFGSEGKMEKCDMCFSIVDPATHSPPCVATCPTGALVCALMTEDRKKSMENELKAFFK